MKKIIFVCTGNTCRSPMAMFLFNKIAKERNLDWIADSAGLAAYGDQINPNSAKSLAKIGIINTNYTSKGLTYYMVDEADLIVVMTTERKSALLNAGVNSEKITVLADGIPDPYGGDEELYLNCLEKISEGIEELLKGDAFN